MEPMRVVLVTCPNEETAVKLATTVVDEGLAACGNLISQVRSIYRWQGKTHDERETMIIFKVASEKLEPFKARVLALHSYDVPELVALPVENASEKYLAWVLKPDGPL